ncbi:MAG: SRPBCC family protein [Chloroflexi bacterium]|nr:SRPBCC family protein [Chloroflexota bacterium]
MPPKPVRVHINRLVDEVYAYMTDLRHLPEWLEDVNRVQLEPPSPLRVGTRIMVEFRAPLGGRMIWVNEVAEYDPLNLVYAERYVQGLFPVAGRWTYEPDGDGCYVSLVIIDWRPDGLTKLMEPLIAMNFQQTYRKGFAKLKRILEASAVGGRAPSPV